MSYNIRKIIANMQLNRRKSAFDRVLSVCHFVKIYLSEFHYFGAACKRATSVRFSESWVFTC